MSAKLPGAQTLIVPHLTQCVLQSKLATHAPTHDFNPQVIAQHLYQEGRFETGDVFVQEARVHNGDALKQPFVAMHDVLCEVCAAVDGSHIRIHTDGVSTDPSTQPAASNGMD